VPDFRTRVRRHGMFGKSLAATWRLVKLQPADQRTIRLVHGFQVLSKPTLKPSAFFDNVELRHFLCPFFQHSTLSKGKFSKLYFAMLTFLQRLPSTLSSFKF
jgi:hypothetical protein